MLSVKAAAAMYNPTGFERVMCLNRPVNERDAAGNAVYARYVNPDEDRIAAVGKMCEPRLKSQRVMGRARDAGWEEMMGTSKMERVAMLPEARRAVVMLRIWIAEEEEEEDIVGEGGGIVGRLVL